TATQGGLKTQDNSHRSRDQTATPRPGLRPAAVALRAAQNSGLACSSERRPGSLASICRWLRPLVSARDEVSAFTITVAAQYLSVRRERPLVHIRTRICAARCPLKPATL